MRTCTITGPAPWASYLINGDASGLTRDERHAADAWLAFFAPFYPVSIEGDEWFTWSYAFHARTLGADGGMVVDYACHAHERAGTLHNVYA